MASACPGIKPCCVPGRSAGAEPEAPAPAAQHVAGEDEARFVRIEATRFLMGSNDGLGHPLDGEAPVRAVELDSYLIDAVSVCNARFARFVASTGYVTEAERAGSSFVFGGLLPEPALMAARAPAAPWWLDLPGACWHAPEGPGSSIIGRENHPVVHVSWNDAAAFCQWAGGRLPTEAERECAARGARVQQRFPWGNELTPAGEHRCNIWQGDFPAVNTVEDGYAGTAPVDTFPPNDFGLFNMVGNVWEWCADWFHPDFHRKGSLINPRGPDAGAARVIRGGSYLCHVSYCFRYRVSARSSAAPRTTTGHTGFRLARDI